MDYDLEIRYFLEKSPKFKEELEDGFLLEEWKVKSSLIDMAIVNGSLIGYEIKSKKDTLYRLKKQISDYTKIFDKITIIADKSHVKAIKDICPDYVGIMLAEENFPIARKAQPNTEDLNYSDVASLLYKEELYEALTEIGLTKIKSKSRLELANIMGNELGSKTSDIVRNQLKARKSQGEWKTYVDPWDKYIENPSLVLQCKPR